MLFVKSGRKNEGAVIAGSLRNSLALLTLLSAGAFFAQVAAAQRSASPAIASESGSRPESSFVASTGHDAVHGDKSESNRCSCGAPDANTSATDDSLVADLQADLDSYLTQRATIEHISAISLSVSLRGQTTLNIKAGTTEYGGGAALPEKSLWQIGSNTKAFTAAILLQLEAEHVLSIEDTVGKWLPEYPAWRKITIKQLLNMTSGIATYDAQPEFLDEYAAAPTTDFSPQRLIAYGEGIALVPGWNYTNTGYQLAQLIIDKATNDTYGHQLRKRLFQPLHLDDMVYRSNLYPPAIIDRMPAGYFYVKGTPQFAPLFGIDVRPLSLSWGQSAGGIVASTEALAKWDRALYEGCVLQPTQQRELESLVSEITGEPIQETTPTDSTGFGLGVQQQNNSLGIIWDYEGATFGFRMLHIYLPASGAVITVGLNSDPDNDGIGNLGVSVLTTLQKAGKI